MIKYHHRLGRRCAFPSDLDSSTSQREAGYGFSSHHLLSFSVTVKAEEIGPYVYELIKSRTPHLFPLPLNTPVIRIIALSSY